MRIIPRFAGVLGALATTFLAFSSAHAQSAEDSAYVFSYFKDNGQDGLHLAWSKDGIKWTPFNNDKALLKPMVGASKLMRDPCLFRGPDGTYQLVWTDSWKSQTIGHSSSTDLIHWTEQQDLEVMKDEPGTTNCWAPEIIWDQKRACYLIYWASTVPGKFPETENGGKNDGNHRIYSTTTKDFKTFTKTELYFDPGHNVIDSTIVPFDGKFVMVYKDETLIPEPKKNLHYAFADTLAGPFKPAGEINAPGSWSEGPTILKVGDSYVVYYDLYRQKRYGALVTKDFKTWKDVSDQISLPKGIRHGTALSAPTAALRGLLKVGSTVQPTSSQEALSWKNPIIPQRADPQVLLHKDGYYYLTATAPEYDRIEVRRAKTLGELSTAEVKTVWKKHAAGTMGAHIWAPEIHYFDNKWYIYFTAGDAKDIWKIRLYVLVNDSPNPLEGDWKELGQIKTEWDTFTLDATIFDHKGKRYIAWAQSAPEQKGTSIFIATMSSPTKLGSKPVLLTSPDLPWERIGYNVNEAPAFLIRNGKIFMTYSASATDANYCLGMLTADDKANLLDPKSWTKSQTPVFKSAPENSQYGPGHNYFTTTPDGKTDILIYHSRNYEKIEGEALSNPDRATRAQVIRWKEDGTPDFGQPVPDGPYTGTP
jgi:GH43 family beta-xylosidase